MAQFRVWKSGEAVEVNDEKNWQFPSSGEKILLKIRPPIAKTLNTD